MVSLLVAIGVVSVLWIICYRRLNYFKARRDAEAVTQYPAFDKAMAFLTLVLLILVAALMFRLDD